MTTQTLEAPADAEAPEALGPTTPVPLPTPFAPSAAVWRYGTTPPEAATAPALAVFCHEPPESYLGGHLVRLLPHLARRGRPVHLFARHAYPFDEGLLRQHVVGASGEGDLVEQVNDYAGRAANAFLRTFPAGAAVSTIGYEWSAAPCLSLLRGLRGEAGVLSLHTLERQRSDATSDIARRIAAIECEGLETARALLIHDTTTADLARALVPACGGRITAANPLFEVEAFATELDPGAIKARYQIGPLDPVLLFVGDLQERYGPDALVKAMPAILRHHPQARLVIVGDGPELWPLKVYARYLLLEHAIRLIGDLQGQPLRELVQASDLVVVPSRESTPWWPIQAAWSARRPVVATHEAARGLTEHEQDSVLVYPSENSVVWGVERVLYDAELRARIAQAGRAKVEQRFGWPALADQVEQVALPLVPLLPGK